MLSPIENTRRDGAPVVVLVAVDDADVLELEEELEVNLVEVVNAEAEDDEELFEVAIEETVDVVVDGA